MSLLWAQIYVSNTLVGIPLGVVPQHLNFQNSLTEEKITPFYSTKLFPCNWFLNFLQTWSNTHFRPVKGLRGFLDYRFTHSTFYIQILVSHEQFHCLNTPQMYPNFPSWLIAWIEQHSSCTNQYLIFNIGAGEQVQPLRHLSCTQLTQAPHKDPWAPSWLSPECTTWCDPQN